MSVLLDTESVFAAYKAKVAATNQKATTITIDLDNEGTVYALFVIATRCSVFAAATQAFVCPIAYSQHFRDPTAALENDLETRGPATGNGGPATGDGDPATSNGGPATGDGGLGSLGPGAGSGGLGAGSGASSAGDGDVVDPFQTAEEMENELAAAEAERARVAWKAAKTVTGNPIAPATSSKPASSSGQPAGTPGPRPGAKLPGRAPSARARSSRGSPRDSPVIDADAAPSTAPPAAGASTAPSAAPAATASASRKSNRRELTDGDDTGDGESASIKRGRSRSDV